MREYFKNYFLNRGFVESVSASKDSVVLDYASVNGYVLTVSLVELIGEYSYCSYYHTGEEFKTITEGIKLRTEEDIPFLHERCFREQILMGNYGTITFAGYLGYFTSSPQSSLNPLPNLQNLKLVSLGRVVVNKQK